MKKLVFPVLLACMFGGMLFAQTIPGDPGSTVVNLNAPDARTIYIGRYGYWSDMPVKMAYLTGHSGKKSPAKFSLFKENGIRVFTNDLRVMKDPGGVMAPVGRDYPEQIIYALDFSKFSTPGTYYIGIDGLPNSRVFRIGGNMPANLELPSLKTFDEKSGVSP